MDEKHRREPPVPVYLLLVLIGYSAYLIAALAFAALRPSSYGRRRRSRRL
ncbi:hypothetical protein ABIC83_002941 [Roseateles asaccharophilus]